VFLCAVSADLVVILEWSARRGAFVLRNKFSTDQPAAAIEFTEQTVLVGTTKFYEIDLKTFSAEEFLDLSHPGIKATVASQAFQAGLPRCGA
jgi:citron Rho-interacting kinase